MKLHSQFTAPKIKLRYLDYVKKVEVLEKTLKKEWLDYPTQEDYLVSWD